MDDDSISLGRFHLAGIQKAKAGEPSIDVTFSIDRNQVLDVSALDIETGQQNQVKITDLSYSRDSRTAHRRGRSLTVL